MNITKCIITSNSPQYAINIVYNENYKNFAVNNKDIFHKIFLYTLFINVKLTVLLDKPSNFHACRRMPAMPASKYSAI
jgi:hypothetical protein